MHNNSEDGNESGGDDVGHQGTGGGTPVVRVPAGFTVGVSGGESSAVGIGGESNARESVVGNGVSGVTSVTGDSGGGTHEHLVTVGDSSSRGRANGSLGSVGVPTGWDLS